MSRRFIKVGALAATVLAGLTLGACAELGTPSDGSSTSPAVTSSADPSTSPTPGASPSGPKITNTPEIPPPAKDTTTLTGTVEMSGVEGGCLVLRTDYNKVYELMTKDRTQFVQGSRVSVVGVMRNDMVSTCQMGPILEVVSFRPA